MALCHRGSVKFAPFGKEQQCLPAAQRCGEIVDLLTGAIAAGQKAQASPVPC